MQRILSKRVLRDIRENLLRYLALFFLVALVMYMVVAIVGAAETIMQGFSSGTVYAPRLSGERERRSVRFVSGQRGTGAGRNPAGTALCGKT